MLACGFHCIRDWRGGVGEVERDDDGTVDNALTKRICKRN